MANIIVSHPKCGRTWLRIILGKIYCDKLGIDDKKMIRAKLGPTYPRFDHDHSSYSVGDAYTFKTLPKSKKRYKKDNIILLIRDPKDVVVSQFMQIMFRRKQRTGNNKINERDGIGEMPIFEFIRDERVGIRKIISFYKNWEKSQEVPATFNIIRYEDMKTNTFSVVNKVINILGVKEISQKNIKEAIKFASFDNMKKMESNNYFNWISLKSNENYDNNGFKTREGKVGGYSKHLSKDDIDYIDNMIKKMKCPWYNFSPINK